MDAKTEIAVTLAAEEWNAVLDVLGDGRFKLVSPLIRKIVEQAQAQQADPQEVERPRLQPVS